MRKIIISLLLLLLGVFAWPFLDYYMMTGSFIPLHQFEKLNSPAKAKGWSTEGFLLDDGRTIPVTGIHQLPASSKALSEMIKRGIEVDAAGHPFALMQLWHWCGNDPVREDIRRVDTVEVLTYMRVGSPDTPPPLNETLGDESRVDETRGWNISDYFGFQEWQLQKAMR